MVLQPETKMLGKVTLFNILRCVWKVSTRKGEKIPRLDQGNLKPAAIQFTLKYLQESTK